jgi:hypothetical protein
MARKKRQIGLGDVVETIAKTTGLDKLVPDDCGCDKRKEKLNGLLSFGKRIQECPTDKQVDYLDNIRGSINKEQREAIADIYFHVYRQPIDATSTCGDCWNNWIKQIKMAI